MKRKMVATMVLIAVLAVKVMADEFYRPIYGSWTNTLSAWTNNINDPAIVRNVILRAGLSNQTFSVDWISLNGDCTNRIVAATDVNATSNSALISIYVPMEIGDYLHINSSRVITNTAGLANGYTIILSPNK
jgi:hypothetical protein